VLSHLCQMVSRKSFEMRGKAHSHNPDFEESTLQNLVADLLRESFDTYLTSVGGSGLGILSPYGQHRKPVNHYSLEGRGQVTPPGTPTCKDNRDSIPLRTLFETRAISELTTWADGLGRWGFV
jgi:hypothetical protein